MSLHTRVRRDTAANWASANPVLGLGEIGFETDTLKLKIGDGATAYASLTYVIYNLASPPAIGGTAAAAGTFNALTVNGSSTLTRGAGVNLTLVGNSSTTGAPKLVFTDQSGPTSVTLTNVNGALGVDSEITSTYVNAAVELKPVASGSPVYIAIDNTVNAGGKRWRIGATGAIGAGTFDIYNETNTLTALSCAATGAVSINQNIASTSTTTGSLTVSGGVGIAGDVYIGGTLHAVGGLAPYTARTSYTPAGFNIGGTSPTLTAYYSVNGNQVTIMFWFHSASADLGSSNGTSYFSTPVGLTPSGPAGGVTVYSNTLGTGAVTSGGNCWADSSAGKIWLSSGGGANATYLFGTITYLT